jgi:hypothetical protein
MFHLFRQVRKSLNCRRQDYASGLALPIEKTNGGLLKTAA